VAKTAGKKRKNMWNVSQNKETTGKHLFKLQ